MSLSARSDWFTLHASTDLYAEVPITDYFSIFAAVGQFAVLSREGRDNLEECGQRDITFGRAGVTFSF